STDTILERIEHRVLKDAPPWATGRCIGRLRLLPVARLPIRRCRRRSGRGLVGRCQRATSERAQDAERQMRNIAPHDFFLSPCCCCDSGFGGGAMRTLAPSVSESGGLTITLSSAARPETTSI